MLNLKISETSKKSNVLILLVLLNSSLVFSQNDIIGIVKDSNSVPLIGVVVCQGKSENCTLTNKNGAFQLNIDKNYGNSITFSYLGYKKVIINSIDTIQSILTIRLDFDDILLDDLSKKGHFKIDPSLKYWGFVGSFQIDMIKFGFDDFSTFLGNDNIELMNKTNTFTNWELSASYNRLQAGIIYGLSSSGNYDHDSLDMDLNNNLYGLSFGYKIVDNTRLVITPKVAVKLYNYRIVNSDKDRRISLNQYIIDRDLDVRFNQTIGFVGASLAYKLYKHNFIFSSDYWTVGFYGGYIFKLNDRPWIYSKRNRLIDDNKINVANFNFGLSISFVVD